MCVQIKWEAAFLIYSITFVIRNKCVQNKQEAAFVIRRMYVQNKWEAAF